MSKCTLKETFIEKLLDRYQPDWKNGKDITAETKEKIKNYVLEKMPDDLKETAPCISDYTIWNMARHIRERKDYPDPEHTNKGKVSDDKPDEDSDHKPEKKKRKPPLKKTIKELLDFYEPDVIIRTIDEFQKKEDDENS